MDHLPSFDVLASVFDDDDGVQEDPFAPLPLDRPIVDMVDDSLLTASIETLLTSFDTPTEKLSNKAVTASNDSMPSFSQQEEQMSAYVESLSKLTKKKKSSHHSKKHKKSHKKKMAAAAAAANVPLPTKPRTAEQLFAQHVRTQLEACGVAKVEWEEIISRRWRSIDPPTRTYFSEFAEREMAFYRNAMKQYKKVCRSLASSRRNKATTNLASLGNNNNLKASPSSGLLKASPSSALLSNLSGPNTVATTPSSSELKETPDCTWILPKPTVITPASSSNDLVDNNNQDLEAMMMTTSFLEPNPLPDVVRPVTRCISATTSFQALLAHNNNNNIPEHTIKNRAPPSMAALAEKLGTDSTLALIQIFAQEG